MSQIDMDILAALKAIDLNNLPLSKNGICEYVYDYLLETESVFGSRVDYCENVYARLAKVFQKWPLAHANKSYPVEGNGNAFWKAAEQGQLWKNPRRIELVKWTIIYLEGICDAKVD